MDGQSQVTGIEHRVIGAVLGSAVGDALGAPFEFGPPHAYSQRFPADAVGDEMCGGGTFDWAPGEFTDDTQMGLIVAESLLEHGRVDGADIFRRFQAWGRVAPDVGAQTAAVLRSGAPWDRAASEYFAAGNRAAGNGSVMQAASSAVYFLDAEREGTMQAGRDLSAITHGDPAAGEGAAIFHELVRAALLGEDPLLELDDILEQVSPDAREKWRTVLTAGWTPADATEPNGAVWPTLGTAVWALRQGWDFERAMREVIDLGGDTDTVAAVTGALLGAVAGVGAIPERWLAKVHGTVPGHGKKVWYAADLREVALRLSSASPR